MNDPQGPLTMSTIYRSIRRSSIGLTIELQGPANTATTSLRRQSAIIDETFRCGSSDVDRLVEYFGARRRDVISRLASGERVSLFLPQRDPAPIRVTKAEWRRAYFTLGELVRWRFLRHLPEYPLKPHQEEGVNWLRSRQAAILADDMGLGKTLQAIAAFELLHRAGKVENALVVCPKSLIGVWEAELRLWAPRLCNVALYTPVSGSIWNSVATQCHVGITNYEAIRSSGPSTGMFDVLILDEVHRLKNSSSLNYQACYNLEPKVTWGLSGTPLENKPGDLTAILHLLDRKRIAPSEERLPLVSLRSLARGHVLRRDKTALSEELSQVTDKLDLVALAPEQKEAYETVLKDAKSYSTAGGWIATFNRLRAICDYDPETEASSKVDRALVILQSVAQLGEKAVVFSWRLDPLRLLGDRLAGQCGRSSFKVITGETSAAERSSIVSMFQTSEEPRFLLCSMRATSEGLTLTAANHVVFLNEWWNPAVNAQARDRVNRIGQGKDVVVYRLRTLGTVESELARILEAKSELFDEVINRLTMATSTPDDQSVPAALAGFLEGTSGGA